MNFQKYQESKPSAGVRREILNMFNEYKEFEDKNGPQVRWKTAADAAEALMAHLGQKFGATFISALEKIGMPAATERQSKMDAPTAAAMWEDAGVYLHGQRVIHRYYINEFGHKFTVPEKEIQHLECDRVPPIMGSSRVGDDDFFGGTKTHLKSSQQS